MNTLLRQLSSVANSLTEFAKSQFAFNSLSQEDQTVLLSYNVPLYLQYVVAKYFSAKTGLDQLNWILQGQENWSEHPETGFIRISLAEYNFDSPFFSSPELMDRYSHLSESVGLVCGLPQHGNGLIANLLLFRTSLEMRTELREPKKIDLIYQV